MEFILAELREVKKRLAELPEIKERLRVLERGSMKGVCAFSKIGFDT